MPGNGNGDNGDSGNGESGKDPLVYETWVEEQAPEVKAMLGENVSGLKTALKSERTKAKGLERELRDAAKKLEDGSDARNQLEAMADNFATAQQESSFYEAAHKAGVNNLKLLFVAAKEEELIRKDGGADFAELKNLFPQLFGPTKIPKGNAGDGSGDPPPGKTGMNAFIRTSAGRRP